MFDLPIAALLARDAVARKVQPAARHRTVERVVREPVTHDHDRRPLRRRAAGTLRGLADRLDSGATAQ